MKKKRVLIVGLAGLLMVAPLVAQEVMMWYVITGHIEGRPNEAVRAAVFQQHGQGMMQSIIASYAVKDDLALRLDAAMVELMENDPVKFKEVMEKYQLRIAH